MDITQDEINKISNLVADLTIATTDINLVQKGRDIQSLLVDIERRISDLRFSTHIYNAGYMSGHNDTVEGNFTDINHTDMDIYQNDVVKELIEDLIK